ncbi:MAG: Rieske 2Fe-2S domain-containing protein [Pseudomonadales bacterium]|nr:Rieske 2Fe-2S domain-containing protein [Pseudomonadales bacterium]
MIATDQQVLNKDSWVDHEKGVVDRRIFSDPGIYAAELENIFARAWNFMCHESQIPETGDFFMNYIGENQVIVVRDRNGEIQVLLNTCPHRGNTVCRADQGKTRSFFCSYHGWNFDLDGKLVGVPGYENFYRSDLDKSEWGLSKAAQVSGYKGFIFATLDPAAPPLEDFLGWVGCLSIDMVAKNGAVEVLDGIQKNRIQCNWKLAVDNLFDWYHPKVSHYSALRTGMIDEAFLAPLQQMVLLGDYGHGISGPGVTEAEQAAFEAANKHLTNKDKLPNWRASEQAKAELGPVGIRATGHPNIFPNLWVSTGGTQLCLRIPRGPLETELWWFTLVEKSMNATERKKIVQMATHFFGPAGLLEQDDGENWSHSTRTSNLGATRDRPLNFAMGRGHDTVKLDPSGQSSIETAVNEHAQLWLYRSWQEWMKAEDWPSLIKNHSAAPTGTI